MITQTTLSLRGEFVMRTRAKTRRLHLETLEDRCLLSTVAAFDLDTPDRGPFPSDRFTVADSNQLTNRRINLPLPDAAARPSDYADVNVLNTLDGFNMQPRLSVSFSGPIDVTTVNSSTVFLVKLGDTTSPEDRGGQVIGINQTVWDVATNTLHVESDQLLEQHTRYALIVTRGVTDTDGKPLEPSEDFERFRHDLNLGQTDDSALQEYRKDLLSALKAARQAGVAEADVVTASVFTTQSATAMLETIRDQIKTDTPEPADFLLGPDGERTVFALDKVTGITWHQQTRVAGPLNPFNVNLALLEIIPDAVGQLVFGKYLSPDYMVHPGEFIPQVGTRTGAPAVQGFNEVNFSLVLPSGPMPEGGWPVAIFGHGSGVSKNTVLLNVAASMASQGIATIAIDVVGHGFGPLSTLTVRQSGEAPVTFAAGGRGFDQNGDGLIGSSEGIEARAPRTIIRDRDGLRQTVVDLMQLVRVIEVGLDVDGDQSPDLDPTRVYYFGQSLGGSYGTVFLAVEPSVQAGVLNVPASAPVPARLSLLTRPGVGGLLAARVPPLQGWTALPLAELLSTRTCRCGMAFPWPLRCRTEAAT
jgi:hypothetical protein